MTSTCAGFKCLLCNSSNYRIEFIAIITSHLWTYSIIFIFQAFFCCFLSTIRLLLHFIRPHFDPRFCNRTCSCSVILFVPSSVSVIPHFHHSFTTLKIHSTVRLSWFNFRSSISGQWHGPRLKSKVNQIMMLILSFNHVEIIIPCWDHYAMLRSLCHVEIIMPGYTANFVFFNSFSKFFQTKSQLTMLVTGNPIYE